jgi:hypothetical protein
MLTCKTRARPFGRLQPPMPAIAVTVLLRIPALYNHIDRAIYYEHNTMDLYRPSSTSAYQQRERRRERKSPPSNTGCATSQSSESGGSGLPRRLGSGWGLSKHGDQPGARESLTVIAGRHRSTPHWEGKRMRCQLQWKPFPNLRFTVCYVSHPSAWK